MRILTTAALALALALAACASAEPPLPPTGGPTPGSVAASTLDAAAATITAPDLLARIRRLSSDAFEGRAPATAGEDSTVNYLVASFKRMGLEPGNPDGTYVQEVPLVGISAKPQASLVVGGKTIALRFPDDYVAVSLRMEPQTKVTNSELVFVGYGVDAPEYDWDDYKDVDVRGKTIVMLINDPAVMLANAPTEYDASVFRGRAMTYYGRWTYKYEEATRRGAAAAIIVHETEPASYPWDVVKGSWGQENFDIVRADRNMSKVPVEAWITVDKAREIFAAAGKDFSALKAAATRRDFRPVPLDGRASFTVDKEIREVRSKNVVAKVTGSDPARRDEYVIYSAHWDHLGKNPSLEGDQIYNGAVDNATGTATVLEVAEAFSHAHPRPARSVLFLAVTAEEKGLLGAKYYANAPLYPLNKTVANINIDAMGPIGPTRDITVIGYGNTTLDDALASEAASVGRTITPDQHPERGSYYRSDHFEFAKVGVPAIYPKTGSEIIGKPAGHGDMLSARYVAEDYHKPSDEVKPDWDLTGLAQDAQLLFRLGYRVASDATWPVWKPGTEFKATREASLKE